MGRVAALLGMDRTTVTAAVKLLERRGLLRVSVDAADRRNRLLHLTEAGREVLVDAVPIWLAMHGEVEAELGTRGGERLRHSLAALV